MNRKRKDRPDALDGGIAEHGARFSAVFPPGNAEGHHTAAHRLSGGLRRGGVFLVGERLAVDFPPRSWRISSSDVYFFSPPSLLISTAPCGAQTRL